MSIHKIIPFTQKYLKEYDMNKKEKNIIHTNKVQIVF